MFMDLDIFYYIILGITVVSYLLGLFLSYFEKKGRISVLSSMGNVGFVNIYGVNMDPPTLEKQDVPVMIESHPVAEVHPVVETHPIVEPVKKQPISYMDPEII